MNCDAKKIRSLADPIAGEMGLEVLDIEFDGGPSGQVVRIYLDGLEYERQVSVSDCGVVSRRLGDVLDAHDAIGGAYMLEVSSPGVNRRLRRPQHFRRVVGEYVRVRTRDRDGISRTLVGKLEEAQEDRIRILADSGETALVTLDSIEAANLEFRFDKPAKPGKKRGRRAGN